MFVSTSSWVMTNMIFAILSSSLLNLLMPSNQTGIGQLLLLGNRGGLDLRHKVDGAERCAIKGRNTGLIVNSVQCHKASSFQRFHFVL